MARIVTFGSNGARIYEGADEKDFKGQSYLVNPKLPRGVPPHLWKLENGQIVGAAAPPKKPFQLPNYVYLTLGLLIGFLLRCII
jgi:hypothetical protein